MSKLSLSRTWEETMAVVARDGRLFVAVGLAMFVLPGVVLNVSMPEAEAGQFPPAGPWMAVALVALLVSLVGQLAVIRLAIGPHVSVGEAITHGVRRLGPYLLSVLVWIVPILLIGSTLYALLGRDEAHPSVAAGLILIVLTLVGMFVAVRLMLSSSVASAEDIGPIAILRRSWDLSRGNWWRLFAFLVLYAIAALCLLWAVESVMGLIVRGVLGDSGRLTVGGLLIALVSQLVSALVSVVFFIMLARVYVQRSGAAEAPASVPNSAD